MLVVVFVAVVNKEIKFSSSRSGNTYHDVNHCQKVIKFFHVQYVINPKQFHKNPSTIFELSCLQANTQKHTTT